MGATCTTENADDYPQRAGTRMQQGAQQYGDEELGAEGRPRKHKPETAQDKCYDFFKTFMDYFCFCICIPVTIMKGCCHYCCNGVANACWKPIDMVAFSCWYEDHQKEFRWKVDEFFQVLNTRKRTLNEACECNCAMEILDEAELRLFLANVTYMKRSLMYNPLNRQNRILRQLVDWLYEEFSAGGSITERSFRNAMVGFFLKEKVKIINKLIGTFNEHHNRAKLKTPGRGSLWGDSDPQPQIVPQPQQMRGGPPPPKRGPEPVAANAYMNQKLPMQQPV